MPIISYFDQLQVAAEKLGYPLKTASVDAGVETSTFYRTKLGSNLRLVTASTVMAVLDHQSDRQTTGKVSRRLGGLLLGGTKKYSFTSVSRSHLAMYQSLPGRAETASAGNSKYFDAFEEFSMVSASTLQIIFRKPIKSAEVRSFARRCL